MVEPGMSGGGENDKFSVESSSVANQSQTPPSYFSYPPPLCTYDDVFSSRELFMETLKKLHAAMGTKFMIPIVGGKDLDLYRLFVEVTSRGGIDQVMKERKWKDVTAVFSFPSSATNASFILRKYYVSLLYHYEQIYFFKAKCWTPSTTDALNYASTVTAAPHSSAEQIHATSTQERVNTATSKPEAPSAGSPVCGVIDGKFESGYLITVKIGSEDFKGVLYQVPSKEVRIVPDRHNLPHEQKEFVQNVDHSMGKRGVPRRKRRKKSEIKKRDPAHPKPNRSAYNFFFAEQHARLKPLYHGRDREISRMIGELWNKLQEPEKTVYQERALKDKERYKLEMEGYRERLRTGQMISNAVPIQQHPPIPEANLMNFDRNLELEGSTSAYRKENETSSSESNNSEKSNMEEHDNAAGKDLDFGSHSHPDMDLKNVNVEILADEEAIELQTALDKIECQEANPGDGAMKGKKELSLVEDRITVPVLEKEQLPPGNDNESVSGH